MPAPVEFSAQCAVIVDLAIEDDLQRAIFVGQRLVAAVNIDDFQPAHRQADIAFDEIAVVVRPAMAQPVVHGRQQFPPDRFPVKMDDAADSAHKKLWKSRLGMSSPCR